MLSEEVIEKVTERLVQRITKTNLFVLKKIARKIKEIGEIMPSNAQQIIQIMDYGGDLDEIVKELAKATKLNVKEIYKIFEEVAKNDQNFAKKYYDYKKKKFIPWEENEFLRREVNAIAEQTAQSYLNLARTRGIGYTIKDNGGNKIFEDVSNAYKNAVDEAILSVSQGKESFDEAMYRVMKDLATSGLKYVDYESGYHRRMDSAIRMNLNDGLKQLHNKTQEIFGREFDSDGVEVTVHEYPAPDHEQVQGRQFSTAKLRPEDMSEWDKFQNDENCYSYDGRYFPAIAEETGRDRRSISEYNCKHYIFAIILGVNKPQYSDEELQRIIDDNEKGFEYDGKHYTLYEGSQLQRKIETKIRESKDMQIMGVESGNKKLAEEGQRDVDRLTKEYYNLSEISGLKTRLDRLRVDGYKPIKIEESSEPNKKINGPKHTLHEGAIEVSIKKEENERLAKIWLDYYDERENDDYYSSIPLGRLAEIRKGNLKAEQLNGYKDEKIKLDSIENCQKLLDKVNCKLDVEKSDIENVDIRLLAEASEGMYEVSRKSPAILDDVRMNVQWLGADKLKSETVGGTFINTVTLNTNYFSDYDSFKKTCIDHEELHNYLDGKKHSWWIQVAKGNETKQTIYHEMGHRLQSAVYYHSTSQSKNPIGFEFWWKKYGEISEYSGDKILPYENSKKVKRDLIYEPIRRLAEKEGLTQKEIIDKYVSMYGRKNYEEMFAEMFAGSQLGKSNALSDELIKFLIEIGEWNDESD